MAAEWTGNHAPQNNSVTIHGQTLLNDIRHQFTRRYPYLSMEFLATKNHPAQANGKNTLPQLKVCDLSGFKGTVEMDMGPQRTITQLVEDFKNLVGLPVRVCRKSGRVWNEISFTNHWTLDGQNKAGETISAELEMDD